MTRDGRRLALWGAAVLLPLAVLAFLLASPAADRHWETTPRTSGSCSVPPHQRHARVRGQRRRSAASRRTSISDLARLHRQRRLSLLARARNPRGAARQERRLRARDPGRARHRRPARRALRTRAEGECLREGHRLGEHPALIARGPDGSVGSGFVAGGLAAGRPAPGRAARRLAGSPRCLRCAPVCGLGGRLLQALPPQATHFLLAVTIAFALLAEAMVVITWARNWQLSWWEWHVLMLSAFLVIAVTARPSGTRSASARSTSIRRSPRRVTQASSSRTWRATRRSPTGRRLATSRRCSMRTLSGCFRHSRGRAERCTSSSATRSWRSSTRRATSPTIRALPRRPRSICSTPRPR